MGIILKGDSSIGTGVMSFSWTTVVGEIPVGTENDANITVSTPGEYVLIVSDDNGVSLPVSLVVESSYETPNITLSASDNGVITSSGQIIRLTATDLLGVNYLWTGSLETTNFIDVNTAGNYEVTATNIVNGCETVKTIEVFENLSSLNVVVSSLNGDTLDCGTQEINLITNVTGNIGNVDYEWEYVNNGLLGTLSTQTVNGSGDYKVTTTDTSNGNESIDTITIYDNYDATTPVANIVSDSSMPCDGSDLLLDSVGSTNIESYEWSDSLGNIIGVGSTQLVTNADTYNLTIYSGGCESTVSKVITDSINLSVDIILPNTNIIPDGGYLTLTSDVSGGDGSYIYAWSTNDGVIEGLSNTSSVNVSSAGEYELTVTDGNDCTGTFQLYANLINGILDTQAPTEPTNLTAIQTFGALEVNLEWVKSEDNDIVSGYQIWRSSLGVTNTMIDTTTGTTYSDSTVVGNNKYVYTVVGFDASSNESGPSNPALIKIVIGIII